MASALRLQAERNPGRVVPGWSDRPTVLRPFARYWRSYCKFLEWGEHTADAAIRWVDANFSDEDDEGRSIVVAVFLDLLLDYRKASAQQGAGGS